MPVVERNGEFIVTSALPDLVVPNQTMGEFLASRITNFNAKLPAIIDAETKQEISYGQLHSTANCLAKSLLKHGLSQSDLTLFYSENRIEYAALVLAITYLGTSYSPVTPANGPYELVKQIENSQGSALIVDGERMKVIVQALGKPEYGKVLSSLKLLIVLDIDQVAEELLQHSNRPKQVITYKDLLSRNTEQLSRIPHFEAKPDDVLVVVYTSGTTGLPKGAVHTHRSQIHSFLNWICCEPKVGLKTSAWFPFGHIAGTMTMWQYLYHGFTMVLHRKPDINLIAQAVERYQVEMLPLTAVFITALAKENFEQRFNLSSIRFIWYGGSKTSYHLINDIKRKLPNATIFEKYGATEFLGSIYNSDLTNPEPGNLGVPCAGVEMKIIDIDSGRSQPPLERGEICFRGAPSFMRYLNNEEETRSTIDADGWYHSGDVGYFDHNGCLFMVDRIKEIIKYKYWSIFPTEIEDFLHKEPAVANVCVVGVPHVTDGYLLRAYVQPNPSHNITESQLIQLVQENLGIQKWLRGGVRFIAQMPRTVIGKVDRQYFKSQVKDELMTEPID